MNTRVTEDQIVEIGAELQDVLPDPTNAQLLDALEDCIGRRGTEIENRLVIAAYDSSATDAKKTVWYDMLRARRDK